MSKLFTLLIWSRALLFMAFFAWFAVSATCGHAADPKAEPLPQPNQATKVNKIVLYPQAEPRPALKYRLLRDYRDLRDGNAVVPLGKVTAEEFALFANQKVFENMQRIIAAPLNELRSTQSYDPALAAPPSKSAPPSNFQLSRTGPLYYLHQAALCKTADWQFPIGLEPYWEILLPELQQTRSSTLILAAHARVEIAQGRLESAFSDIQDLFAVGRHIAASEVVVGGLVGCFVCRDCAAEQLEIFIQQPNAPNMYWALAQMPSPLIDMRDSIDLEMRSLELTFLELRDVETQLRTPGEWQAQLTNVFQTLYQFYQHAPNDKPLTASDVERLIPKLAAAAKVYFADRNWSKERIAKLNDAQLILLEFVQRGEEEAQEVGKWFHLPFPQAAAGLHDKNPTLLEVMKKGKLLERLPTFGAERLYQVRVAQVRTDRAISVLRVLEALRLHAAANDAKLPASLADIKEVPIPDDPVTGKPFEYKLTGETAMLSGPELEAHDEKYPLQYEITLGKK